MYRAALPLLLAGAGSLSAALKVDFKSPNSIKSAAKDVAFDLMSYYKGNESGEIPGIFSKPPPDGTYNPWTGAILWSTIIDYWHYTGDDTYNALASQGLVHQNEDAFVPQNWTNNWGNDDQGFWALAAMSAAELKFPNAPKGEPSWIDLAQSVFNSMEERWIDEENPEECNGGLRWQIAPTNKGYEIKNTMSNAIFMNLGARLGRFTGNQTYVEWVDKTWNWLTNVGLINSSMVYDSVSVDTKCAKVNTVYWGAPNAIVLETAAYMYNQTTGDAQATWQARLKKMVPYLAGDFPFAHGDVDTSVLFEYACELKDTCNRDTRFYKGITLRALTNLEQLAPFIRNQIEDRLRTTAEAVAKVCAEGESGRACPYRWTYDYNWERKKRDEEGDDVAEGGDDIAEKNKTTGQQPEELNALSALLAVLVDASPKGFATNASLIEEGWTGEDGSGSDSGSDGGSGDGDDGSGSGSEGGSDKGDGSGSGSEGGSGNGDGSQGNGNGGSAGTTTRVAFGLMLAGLVAAMF